MVLSPVGYHLTQQECACRPAPLHQLMTFCNGVIVAISAIRADQPGFAGKASFVALRNDLG